jgi:flavin-binding protein dodecin
VSNYRVAPGSDLTSEHVYKTIELTGSSKASSDDAVRNALAKVDHWQVTIKVGFTLED